MTLRDLMARHARGTLTRPDHFGESVVYRFKSGAPDRTVRAVVDRLDREPAAPELRQVAKLRAIVAIPNDATDGITAWEPGDQVELAMRLGDDPVVARVKRAISQDEGVFSLEVEA